MEQAEQVAREVILRSRAMSLCVLLGRAGARAAGGTRDELARALLTWSERFAMFAPQCLQVNEVRSILLVLRIACEAYPDDEDGSELSLALGHALVAANRLLELLDPEPRA